MILLAVRWSLRYGLSNRDIEELLAERGVDVDHVTIYRWVQRFTPLLIEAALPCRHSVDDRWFVDETYVRVAGSWRYVYRAADQRGQIIEVYVSKRRNIAAARTLFEMMLDGRELLREVTTDLAAPLLHVVDDAPPEVLYDTTQFANNRVEWDHGRLKVRLWLMRGLRTASPASWAADEPLVEDGDALLLDWGLRVGAGNLWVPETLSWPCELGFRGQPLGHHGWPVHWAIVGNHKLEATIPPREIFASRKTWSGRHDGVLAPTRSAQVLRGGRPSRPQQIGPSCGNDLSWVPACTGPRRRCWRRQSRELLP